MSVINLACSTSLRRSASLTCITHVQTNNVLDSPESERTFSQWRHYVTQRSRAIRNHYDVLGLTPKVSQKEVKAAYYKLSKQYHPDVNKSEGAKVKFSEISEAYEVLGNVKNRRQYDRGVSGSSQSAGIDVEYEEFVKKTGQFGKRKKPIMRGKTSIYDFDAFYEEHYGDSVRKAYEKEQMKKEYSREVEHEKESNLRSLGIFAGFMVGVVLAALRAKKF